MARSSRLETTDEVAWRHESRPDGLLPRIGVGLTCSIPPRSGAFLNRDPVPVQFGDRRGRSQQAADSANDRRLVLRWPRTDGSPILGPPRARIRDLGDLSGHGTGDSSANAVSGNVVVGRATGGNPSGPTAGPFSTHGIRPRRHRRFTATTSTRRSDPDLGSGPTLNDATRRTTQGSTRPARLVAVSLCGPSRPQCPFGPPATLCDGPWRSTRPASSGSPRPSGRARRYRPSGPPFVNTRPPINQSTPRAGGLQWPMVTSAVQATAGVRSGEEGAGPGRSAHRAPVSPR